LQAKDISFDHFLTIKISKLPLDLLQAVKTYVIKIKNSYNKQNIINKTIDNYIEDSYFKYVREDFEKLKHDPSLVNNKILYEKIDNIITPKDFKEYLKYLDHVNIPSHYDYLDYHRGIFFVLRAPWYIIYKHKQFVCPIFKNIKFNCETEKFTKWHDDETKFISLEKEITFNSWCKNKQRFKFIYLVLTSESTAHANIIIIDSVKKTIERFEPHGQESPYNCNNKIDSVLKKEFSIIDNTMTYINPKLLCPTFKGPQQQDSMCLMWAYIYLDLRLQFPDMPQQQIISNMQFINLARLTNFSYLISKQKINFVKDYSKDPLLVIWDELSIRIKKYEKTKKVSNPSFFSWNNFGKNQNQSKIRITKLGKRRKSKERKSKERKSKERKSKERKKRRSKKKKSKKEKVK